MRILAAICLLSISSSAFAGAAFHELTTCKIVGTEKTLEINVVNSSADGYSHDIILTENGKGNIIASVDGGNMDMFLGKFPVVIAGKKGSLVFDSEASFKPTY